MYSSKQAANLTEPLNVLENSGLTLLVKKEKEDVDEDEEEGVAVDTNSPILWLLHTLLGLLV